MRRLIVTLLTLTMLLSGCLGGAPANTPSSTPSTSGGGSAPATSQPKKSDLVIAVHQDVTNFDPRMGSDVVSIFYYHLVFAPLLFIEDDFSLRPNVAEEWENPDPQTYIFKLKKGVKFHDGTELTAEDVKYTYDTIRDPDFMSPLRSNFSAIDEIIVRDSHTVEFKLKNPFPPLLYNLDRGIVPKHVVEKDYDAFKKNPIGAGPVKFKQWVANNRLEMTRFDDYFGGPINFKDVTMRVITEDPVRLTEQLTGGIDVAFRIPQSDVKRLQNDKQVQVLASPPDGYSYLMMNLTVEPFDNPLVRKAIAYATNKEELNELVYFGLTATADGPILPGHWAATNDLVRYPYNPEKAKELLAEAGYPNGFEVEFKTYSQSDKVQTIEALAAQLAKVGIKLNVSVTEWTAYFAEIVKGDYAFTGPLFWYYQTDPDTALYRQFHSSQHIPVGANRNFYANARLDELLDMARRDTDQTVRAGYYAEVQKILTDELPYLVLSHPIIFVSGDNNLQNLTFSNLRGWFDLVVKGAWK